MPQPDVFALQNSGLNAFLLAEVGTETNGSVLTILSMLARLGEDPWTEAGLWARQPRAATVDVLAAAIGRMPLTPVSLQNAHATAVRLVDLLPEPDHGSQKGAEAEPGALTMPRWAWIGLTYLWLYFIMNMGVTVLPRTDGTQAAPAVTTLSSVALAGDKTPRPSLALN